MCIRDRNADDDPRDDDGDGLTNKAEELIHGTDPYQYDSDGGGVDDGTEVLGCTDPSKKDDDSLEDQCNDADNGTYIVPAECDTCPCRSTLLNKADLVPGDIFFPVIMAEYEDYYDIIPKEKIHIFSKGDEVMIQEVPGLESNSVESAVSSSL